MPRTTRRRSRRTAARPPSTSSATTATDAGTNVVTGATDGAHGTVTFDDNSVAYTPAADYNGSDSFTYTVTNDDGPSTATVDVTVTAVNDPPSFTPGGDVSVDEDSGPAAFPGWASGFDPGALERGGPGRPLHDRPRVR